MFPVKIKATKLFIEEFQADEEGSYDDMSSDFEKGQLTEIPLENHTFNVLGRHKTVIRIENDIELADIYYRLGSGLTRERFERTCERIQGELRELAEAYCPETFNNWTIPS